MPSPTSTFSEGSPRDASDARNRSSMTLQSHRVSAADRGPRRLDLSHPRLGRGAGRKLLSLSSISPDVVEIEWGDTWVHDRARNSCSGLAFRSLGDRVR